MRSLLAVGSMSFAFGVFGAFGAFTTGCAASLAEPAAGPEPAAPASRTSREGGDGFQVTEGAAPLATTEAPPPRRRLAQTVTLGQGTTEPLYPAPPPNAAAGAGGNVVNNNVTVVNGAPPAYGGYGYGGYGYGGYGYGARSAGIVPQDYRFGGSTPRSFSTGAWAPSGWEGAQRTAAPGRTPGVGGNWAPAPSFGPRSMR